MSLSRFWNSLEALSGSADSRHGWSGALGGSFEPVSGLLRRTGAVASTVSCPSPGGQSCPRTVCPDGDDAYIAVCGNRPAECPGLKLSVDDVRIYALDVERLAAEIAVALSLRSGFGPVAIIRQAWRLGYCEVAAGAAFPVFLSIQRSDSDYIGAIAQLREICGGPLALLVPTRRILTQDFCARLGQDDVADLDALFATLPLDRLNPKIIFPKAWRSTLPAEGGGTGATDRAWLLPADARWEEVRFTFEATEMVRVTFRKETRSFEPVDLKMRDERKKRPNLQWKALQGLAFRSGTADWIDKKQKQALSNRLRAAFGIPDDPIVWDAASGAYCARFLISGDVLSDRR